MATSRWGRGCAARAAAAAGVVLVIVGAAGTVAGGQEADRPFSAVAGADGVRGMVVARGYAVVEELVDVAAPSAQATMDAVEGSGLAAYLWPGSTTFFGLNTAGTRSGQPLADAYPLARSSTSGQPESKVENGPIVLASKSSPSESTAAATGTVATDTFTAADVSSSVVVGHDPASGTAKAEAVSVAEGVTVADVLSFGVVRSRATVTSPPSGGPTRKGELEITRAMIAGQEVTIRPDGLTLAGSGTPLPTENPFAEALAEAGVTLQYIDAVEAADGLIAAGLRITVTREVPNLPEPVEIVYELGRARAFAQGGSRSATADLDGGLDLGLGPEVLGGTGVGTESGLSVADTSGDVPALERASPTPPSATGAGRATSEPLAGRLVRAGGEGVLVVDAGMFYPALLGAGALLLCGATLTRLFGVRLLWSS